MTKRSKISYDSVITTMNSKKENGESLHSLDCLVPMGNEKLLITTNTKCTTMKLPSTNQLCYFKSYNFITAALQAIRVQSVSQFV